MIYISNLKVTNFRMIKKLELQPAKVINIISGKNGTAKSTLLGMIAQGFSFNNKVINFDSLKDSGVDGLTAKTVAEMDSSDPLVSLYSSLKTLLGESFESRSNNHFKLSNSDARGIKHCEVTLKDNQKTIETFVIKSTNHKDRIKPRFVTRRQNGDSSNFVLPLIYIGLDRLNPLVKATKTTEISTQLNEHEKKEIHNLYQSILLKEYKNNFTATEANIISKKNRCIHSRR